MSAEQTAQIFVLILHLVLESHHRHVMEGYARVGLQHSQMLESFLSYLGEIFRSIFVFTWFYLEVQFTVGLVGLIKTISFGNVALKLLVDN